MIEKIAVVRGVGLLVSAGVLLFSPSYLLLRGGCAIFVIACAVDYLTRGTLSGPPRWNRYLWMPTSWRKAFFSSGLKR